MIAFLKTELAGEPGYQLMLMPGWAITVEQDIEFFVAEKMNPHAIEDDWPCCFMYFPNQPGSERERAERDPQLIPQEKRLMGWPKSAGRLASTLVDDLLADKSEAPGCMLGASDLMSEEGGSLSQQNRQNSSSPPRP